MLFSRATGYGIRASSYLASKPPGTVCGVREIARCANIPPVFLRKILGELRRRGILHSEKGIYGGYRLARSAGDITLWEMVQLLDAEPNWDTCLLGDGRCQADAHCALGKGCSELRQGLNALLRNRTLNDVAGSFTEHGQPQPSAGGGTAKL